MKSVASANCHSIIFLYESIPVKRTTKNMRVIRDLGVVLPECLVFHKSKVRKARSHVSPGARRLGAAPPAWSQGSALPLCLHLSRCCRTPGDTPDEDQQLQPLINIKLLSRSECYIRQTVVT